jgi:hypothetical protein
MSVMADASAASIRSIAIIAMGALPYASSVVGLRDHFQLNALAGT